MKTRNPNSVLLVMAALVTGSGVFFGCQSNSPQSQPTRQEGVVEPIRNNPIDIHSPADFLVIKSASVISGEVSTDDRRVSLGLVSFGPDNEVRWNGNRLSVVEKLRGTYRFYDHVSKRQLRMGTDVDLDDRNAAVLVEANGIIGKIIFVGTTQNGRVNRLLNDST